MLTLKRKPKPRVPPQRGRGEISGLFFCCAQSSILAVAVSTGSPVLCRCDDCAQQARAQLRAPRVCYVGPAMVSYLDFVQINGNMQGRQQGQ